MPVATGIILCIEIHRGKKSTLFVANTVINTTNASYVDISGFSVSSVQYIYIYYFALNYYDAKGDIFQGDILFASFLAVENTNSMGH